jgi:TonB family protein
LQLNKPLPPTPKPKPATEPQPKPVVKPLTPPVKKRPEPAKPVTPPKPVKKTAPTPESKPEKSVAKIEKRDENRPKLAQAAPKPPHPKTKRKTERKPSEKTRNETKKRQKTQKPKTKRKAVAKRPHRSRTKRKGLAGRLMKSGTRMRTVPTRNSPAYAERMIRTLYGKEYYNFTPAQKRFIKSHLDEIRRITQNTLVLNGYPDIAVRTGQQGTNVVTFYLHPNGDISGLRLLRPMGYEALDKNTLEVIRIAYKDYPRPKEKTKITFYVTYKLY